MPDGRLVEIGEWLYRTSWLPEKKYMNPDGSATSRVFKLRAKDNGKLSVDVKSMTSPEKSVGNASRFFLFELPNQAVIESVLSTYHDPLEDGSNDAHAVILGMDLDDDVAPGVLARASKRVVLS